jgi:hypothetical protein
VKAGQGGFRCCYSYSSSHRKVVIYDLYVMKIACYIPHIPTHAVLVLRHEDNVILVRPATPVGSMNALRGICILQDGPPKENTRFLVRKDLD